MNEFKVGDKVRCIKETPIPESFHPYGHYTCYVGQICTVWEVYNENLLKMKTEDTYISFQDKNSFELVEEKEMEKEEFKVDKLGWYLRRDGSKIKVIFIRNEDYTSYHRVIAIDQNEECWWYCIDGKYMTGTMDKDYNLIKYLGPELPKEPLKFEIESNFCTTRFDGKNILCLCGENEVNFEIPYNAIKKFKVTFEELPND